MLHNCECFTKCNFKLMCVKIYGSSVGLESVLFISQSFGRTSHNCDIDAAKGSMQVMKRLAHICQHCVNASVNSY